VLEHQEPDPSKGKVIVSVAGSPGARGKGLIGGTKVAATERAAQLISCVKHGIANIRWLGDASCFSVSVYASDFRGCSWGTNQATIIEIWFSCACDNSSRM